MSVRSLESEVAKLGDAEFQEFGLWFDSFREQRQFSGEEMPPDVEEAHREEVLNRKEEYLRDKSIAKPMDAAYFADLRKKLGYA
jgi:hypothetical protein